MKMILGVSTILMTAFRFSSSLVPLFWRDTLPQLYEGRFVLEINNNKFITHVAQNTFEYDLMIGELPSSTD